MYILSFVAYEVLLDPEKRKKYDMYGEDFENAGHGGGGHGGAHGFNFNFNDFFKDFDDAFHTHKQGGHYKQKRPHSGPQFFDNLFDDIDDDEFGSFNTFFGNGHGFGGGGGSRGGGGFAHNQFDMFDDFFSDDLFGGGHPHHNSRHASHHSAHHSRKQAHHPHHGPHVHHASNQRTSETFHQSGAYQFNYR